MVWEHGDADNAQAPPRQVLTTEGEFCFLELVVGLDQSSNDSFVMPVKEQLQVYEDPTLHRQQRAGYYGWSELGFGVLDNRRIILGSF